MILITVIWIALGTFLVNRILNDMDYATFLETSIPLGVLLVPFFLYSIISLILLPYYLL